MTVTASSGSGSVIVDVAFLYFDIHYQANSFGSDEEYIK